MFPCFYTNSTFKTSCDGWIDTGIPALWADEVPAVTQDAPRLSRRLRSK